MLWTGGTSFWDVSGNWQGDAVPGASNDVIIDVDGVHTVTVRSTGRPFTVNSINMNGGDETLAISNGSLTLLGAATVDNPTGESVITNLIMSGASAVLAGAGNLTVTGSASLSSGATMTGTGTTTLQGTTTISGSEFALDDGRVLRNEGTLTWSGFTGINLNPNTANGGVGSIVNAAGAVSTDGTPTFDNAGMFVKSGGAGDTFIGAQFNNTGTLEVQMGNVRLAGGSTHTGATLLSTGNGTIEFSNGVHTLDAATSLTATNVEFSFTGTTTIAGVYDVSGTTTLGSGYVATFLPGADLQSLGTTLVLSGFGELNLDAHDVSVVTLTASGIGTVSGTGTLTVTGTASLAGTMTGAGTTHLLEDTTTTINSAFNLDVGRVLLNEGTVNWTGGTINLNPVNTNNGVGHIINAAGATWNTTLNNGTITRQAIQTDGVAMFDNAGRFVRSGSGTGTTTINVEFNNT
ncbi:MAG TPA: hypothetical protein VMM93_13375, partial [Vicinamibacterales bacterium]|nr:hypothetical protein [Vicinamibacterales bacterium]